MLGIFFTQVALLGLLCWLAIVTLSHKLCRLPSIYHTVLWCAVTGYLSGMCWVCADSLRLYGVTGHLESVLLLVFNHVCSHCEDQ